MEDMESNEFFTLQHNADTVVFIPSTEFHIAHIQLPQLKHIKTKKAFLYALEQDLCDDIEDLDVMVLDNTTVAVYKKSLLNTLSKNYPKITRALPDYFALPYENNTWTVFPQNDSVIVRTGLFEGFRIEKNNFDLYLDAAAEKPLKINRLPENTDLKDLVDIPELSLLDHIKNYSPLFHKQQLQKWRWPLILFSSWLVLLFLSDLTKYIYLRHQLNTTNTTLSARLMALYPTAKSSENIEARLQRDMHLYSKQSDKFWLGLSTISPLLQQSDITLTSLHYENNQFDLTLSTTHSGIFQAFNNHLKTKNITILANNISSENQQYTETLSLKVLS